MNTYFTSQDSIHFGIEETYDFVMNELYNRYHVQINNAFRTPTTRQNQSECAFFDAISKQHSVNPMINGSTPIGKFVY